MDNPSGSMPEETVIFDTGYREALNMFVAIYSKEQDDEQSKN